MKKNLNKIKKQKREIDLLIKISFWVYIRYQPILKKREREKKNKLFFDKRCKGLPFTSSFGELVLNKFDSIDWQSFKVSKTAAKDQTPRFVQLLFELTPL